MKYLLIVIVIFVFTLIFISFLPSAKMFYTGNYTGNYTVNKMCPDGLHEAQSISSDGKSVINFQCK